MRPRRSTVTNAPPRRCWPSFTLLADTGNFKIAGCVAQHRRMPLTPTRTSAAASSMSWPSSSSSRKAHIVICDASLSPAQGRNIEKAVKVPSLDRSELILHIFGTHARTPQAKLQVELAAPAVSATTAQATCGPTSSASAAASGIRGGAGEKQIDLDRSELRSRIAQISRQIKRIQGAASRARSADPRPIRFTIALVGYTNAGKSTLMNRLTDADVLTEDRLFSTLDTRTPPLAPPRRPHRPPLRHRRLHPQPATSADRQLPCDP